MGELVTHSLSHTHSRNFYESFARSALHVVLLVLVEHRSRRIWMISQASFHQWRVSGEPENVSRWTEPT